MRPNHPTLLQFMQIWQGQQCWLRVQGSRVYLQWENTVQNNQFNSILNKGKGVFSNIHKRQNKHSYQKTNNHNQWNPKQNMRMENRVIRQRSKYSVDNQYTINARSKSPLRLNQLAEKYEENMDRQFERNKKMDHYSTKTKVSNNKYDFKFPKNNHICEVPSKFDAYQIKPPHSDININNMDNANNQQSNLQSIMQSIKDIKLPQVGNSRCTKQYRQANNKFQLMKKDILDKIVSNDIQFQLTEILAEIQEAADQIILKHKVGDVPQLKRNGTFSFNDLMMDQNFNPKRISQKQKQQEGLNRIQEGLNRIQEGLNRIQEETSQNNSNFVKLPPFQDQAGSISSIISDLGHRKYEDQDQAKIDNIFIINAENKSFDTNSQNQSISLKQCKIQQKLTSNQKIQSSIKENSKVLAAKKSLKPQPTQPASEAINKSPQCKNTSIEVLPLTSNFGDQNSVMGSRRKTSATTYLHYNPNSPIKIAKNLDEAKQIDPQIVKFTEYKVKFLEPKVQQTNIITFASPHKFRRKQEVVKHLVANHIVQKESNSIEYHYD